MFGQQLSSHGYTYFDIICICKLAKFMKLARIRIDLPKEKGK